MSVPHGTSIRNFNDLCKLRIRATLNVETSYPLRSLALIAQSHLRAL